MLNNWIKNNDKSIILFMLLIAVFLIFQDKVESVFAPLGNLISYDSVGFKIGCIIVFLIVCLIYVALIERKYIPNKNSTFVIILIFICYFITRLSSSALEFHPIDTGLKYLDFTFFILLLHIILIRNSFKKDIIQSIQEEKNTFFLQDSIHHGIIDNELILDKLVAETLGFKPEDSFSIGLNASWGYGKSTFLNRFKIKYEEKNKDAIVFWYRIWKNKGSHAIIDNFFQELAKNLEPYSGEISSEINKYVNAILHLTPSELGKIVEAGKNILQEEESLETHYEKIKNSIKKIDRQIIILLDDLDRLEEDEILDTFKIIRTLSDFNNIIFIAGYDRVYLGHVLGKNKESYINKIFQVEINLLPFDERRIRDLLLDEIRTSFPITEKSSLNSKLYKGYYLLFNKSSFDYTPTIGDLVMNTKVCSNKELSFNLFINTYRDIKRFVNEFKFNYSFINSEDDINIKEYVLLKLFVFKYRGLQNSLFVKIDEFLSKQVIDNVNKDIIDTFGTYADIYIYNEQAKEKVFKLLEEYNDEDKEIIDAVLCDLFGKKPFKYYEEYQNSISKIYHTNTYVRNNIAGAKYTFSDFKKAFKDSKFDELIEELKSLTSQTSSQVFNEMKLFLLKQEIKTKNDFSTLIKGINSLNAELLFNDGQKVIDIIKSVYEEVYKENKAQLLDVLNKTLQVSKIGYLDYLLGDININNKRLKRVDLGYSNTNSKKYENIVFTEEEIKKLLISKYEYIIDNSSRIDLAIEGYHLYIEAIAGDHKIIKSKEGNTIFRKDFDKRFTDYFGQDFFDFNSDFPGGDTRFKTYKPNDFLCQIFSNPKTLSDLLKDSTSTDLLNKLTKEGWNNYNKYIDNIEDLAYYTDKHTLERLDKIKRLVKKFIDKGYKPINHEEYSSIWDS